jgi:hypothetical protein
MPYFSLPTNDPTVKQSSIVSMDQFTEKLDRMQELRSRLGRQGPFEVAVGSPFRPKTSTRVDADRFLEGARELEARGATWTWTKLVAPSRAAFLENVAWFGEEIIARFDGGKS